MNAAQIITDDMSLEEKLSAIDAAMQAAQAVADEQARANGSVAAPIDPASLTVCDGCE
ncbi:hypothetical protein [Candidatus Nanosynbacter lyticus]|uniref:hypothetical protein n=1 Tax=Candidatus Nanosynbacter lyticus TaxID=2093824 RepID=UPI00255326A4|nr:hypothetical protein [Candidatus Nanosynbacter lyticus]WLD46449.1 hypothetical protein NLML1_0059 [Candidatus Nanosynbacter lyticus]